MYVLIPFGVPVHAEGAGMIPREKMFFSTVLVCTGFGKSRIPRDFTARERKTTGKQTFPRESFEWEWKSGFTRERFGWEWDTEISSGTGWVGPRERYLHGNGK